MTVKIPALNLTIDTAPTVEPVSLSEVRRSASFRVNFDDEDLTIYSFIKTARAHFDGPDGVLGRTLIETTYIGRLDSFPADGVAIELPLPPLVSVTSVKYTDDDDVEQTLSASSYTVKTGVEPGLIAADQWPSGTDVVIEFVAGYGETAATVPEPIRQAIILMASDLYDGKDSTAAIDRLILPYRFRSY